MIKSGTTIKCRVCKKEVYLPACRVGLRWYCSRECATKDIKNQHKEKKRKCVICGVDFTFTWPIHKKTCSDDCRKALATQIANKHSRARVEKKCKECGILFSGIKKYMSSGRCKDCRFKKVANDRKGKGNPAYRNGFAMQGKRTYTGIHLRACSKYRKAFLERWGYLFCEVCHVNANGTPKFEVHHIYFASLYPKHIELHNRKNLVLVCIGCHNNFHAGKKFIKEFKKLEKERGLRKLFALKDH